MTDLKMTRQSLYECTSCGHLHQEKVSQCDCSVGAPAQYREWIATPADAVAMTADKRIDAFEAAFVRKYGFGRMTASSNDEAMAMYAAAYWAWIDCSPP